MSIGDFPDKLSQQILVGTILVGRLGVPRYGRAVRARTRLILAPGGRRTSGIGVSGFAVSGLVLLSGISVDFRTSKFAEPGFAISGFGMFSFDISMFGISSGLSWVAYAASDSRGFLVIVERLHTVTASGLKPKPLSARTVLLVTVGVRTANAGSCRITTHSESGNAPNSLHIV